jgi:recombination protein RecA
MLNKNIGQGCALDCAELMEVVAKKGSWYSYKDMRYVRGFRRV